METRTDLIKSLASWHIYSFLISENIPPNTCYHICDYTFIYIPILTIVKSSSGLYIVALDDVDGILGYSKI